MERVVEISRNAQFGFDAFAPTYHSRPYLLTGGPGSGKTTFALARFFYERLVKHPSERVLVIQPVDANIANFLEEWDVNGPVRRHLRNMGRGTLCDIPLPVAVPFDSTSNSYRFIVTSVDSVFRSLAAGGSLNSFQWVVLDEQHQRTLPMTFVREYLRSDLYGSTYVMISATPDGRPSRTTLSSQLRYVDYRGTPNEIMRGERAYASSLMNPMVSLSSARNLLPNQSYVVVYVAPTRVQLLKARDYAASFNVHASVVTDRSSVEQFTAMLRRVKTPGRHLVILTPDVEAGITIPMDVLVDTGYTSSIEFANNVLVEKLRTLAADERVQRYGRGGRVRPTTVVRDITVAAGSSTPGDNYLLANALVHLIALGADISRYRQHSVMKEFSRLKDMTVQTARAAVAGSQRKPLLSSYRYDTNGELFSLCGGTAPGFEDANKHDLRLFSYSGGSDPQRGIVVLPLVDLTDPSFTPDDFVPKTAQQDLLASLMRFYAPDLARISDNERLELLTARIDDYLVLIVEALESVYADLVSKSADSPVDQVYRLPHIVRVFLDPLRRVGKFYCDASGNYVTQSDAERSFTTAKIDDLGSHAGSARTSPGHASFDIDNFRYQSKTYASLGDAAHPSDEDKALYPHYMDGTLMESYVLAEPHLPSSSVHYATLDPSVISLLHLTSSTILGRPRIPVTERVFRQCVTGILKPFSVESLADADSAVRTLLQDCYPDINADDTMTDPIRVLLSTQRAVALNESLPTDHSHTPTITALDASDAVYRDTSGDSIPAHDAKSHFFIGTGPAWSSPSNRRDSIFQRPSPLCTLMDRLLSLPGFKYIEKDLTVTSGNVEEEDFEATRLRNERERREHEAKLERYGRAVAVSQSALKSAESHRDEYKNVYNEWVRFDREDKPQLVAFVTASTRILAQIRSGALSVVENRVTVIDTVMDALMYDHHLEFDEDDMTVDIDSLASCAARQQSVLSRHIGNSRDIQRELQQAEDSVELAKRELATAQYRFDQLGTFEESTDVVKTASGVSKYKLRAYLTIERGKYRRIIPLILRTTYLQPGTRFFDMRRASNDLYDLILPRLGPAALRKARPELFIDLGSYAPYVPPDHAWYFTHNKQTDIAT